MYVYKYECGGAVAARQCPEGWIGVVVVVVVVDRLGGVTVDWCGDGGLVR